MKHLHLLIDFIDLQGMFDFGSWHAMCFSQGVTENYSPETKPIKNDGWKTIAFPFGNGPLFFFGGTFVHFLLVCFELMDITQKCSCLPHNRSLISGLFPGGVKCLFRQHFHHFFMARLARAWCGTKPRIRSGSPPEPQACMTKPRPLWCDSA